MSTIQLRRDFPRYGKLFSTLWKTAGLALGLAVSAVRAEDPPGPWAAVRAEDPPGPWAAGWDWEPLTS